jgi:LSD1 subclass zinc finger protein
VLPPCGLPMPKNPPPPTCPKCRAPMHFLVIKTGARKFRCVKCDAVDPIRISDIPAWMIDKL